MMFKENLFIPIHQTHKVFLLIMVLTKIISGLLENLFSTNRLSKITIIPKVQNNSSFLTLLNGVINSVNHISTSMESFKNSTDIGITDWVLKL
jgi:hypothetical protein